MASLQHSELATATGSVRRDLATIAALLGVALLTLLGLPVYHQFTAHALTLEVAGAEGAFRPVPVPAEVWNPNIRTSIGRRRPDWVLRIVDALIEKDMNTRPAGPPWCTFRWTLRYSYNSPSLDHTKLLRVGRARCP